MISKNTPNDTIPFVAYGMIGITTLVLAYATLMDKQPTIAEDNKSATTMLPELGKEKTPTEVQEPAVGMPVVPVSPIVPPPLDQLNKLNPDQPAEEKIAPEPAPGPLAQAGGKSKKSKHSKKRTRKHK